jgi:predicted ATPase
MGNPFGDLLTQFRARKYGLSMSRLAELAGYDRSVISKMSRGMKELTGPSGRERVVRIIGALGAQGVRLSIEEANSLFAAGGMPPLFPGYPDEAALIAELVSSSPAQNEQSTPKVVDLEALHNLPVQLTRFVGRQAEMETVQKLLASTRLLTLTGSGGCGKTRLALEVAASMAAQLTTAPSQAAYPDGLWLVELATLADPIGVADTIAAVLPVHGDKRPDLEALIMQIRYRHMLIILDNCEHVLQECAEVVSKLLGACPYVQFMATSRERINIPGEVTWRIPSLQIDEAVDLFVERGRTINSEISREPRHAVTIAHICERLDCIPLAIELAAACLHTLPVEQISAHLDERFQLLVAGSRTALPRHRTLQALIDWSYDLLEENERLLLCRVSVFADRWTLDAAQAVCSDDMPGDQPCVRLDKVLNLLMNLVGKSLVSVQHHDGESHFMLLETIRAYGLDKLGEKGEYEALRARHARWCLQLAESAEPRQFGREQIETRRRIRAEMDNLRAALHWCLDLSHDVTLGTRLALALWIFWFRGSWGDMREGRRWMDSALQNAGDKLLPADWARVVLMAGVLAGGHADLQVNWSFLPEALQYKQSYLQQALPLCQAAGDREGCLLALCGLGRTADLQGDHERAMSLFEQALAICEETRFPEWYRAYIYFTLNYIAAGRHEYQRAFEYTDASLDLWHTLGDVQGSAMAYIQLADIHYYQLDFPQAIEYTEQGLSFVSQVGDAGEELWLLWILGESYRFMGMLDDATLVAERFQQRSQQLHDTESTANAWELLGKIARDRGDYSSACHYFVISLQVYQRRALASGTTPRHPYLYCDLATVAAVQNDPYRAARLLGAAGMAPTSDGVAPPIMLVNRFEYAPYILATRTQLGDAAFRAAWEAGHAMTTKQAVKLAIFDSEQS